MKDIMAGESTDQSQGVPHLTYNPATIRQPVLFSYSRPLDDLAGDLLVRYAGRHVTVKNIIEEHNVGTPYIAKNYKSVLLEMEQAGVISAVPSKRRSGTMAEKVHIIFPPKEQ
jgi:hypothetical protein